MFIECLNNVSNGKFLKGNVYDGCLIKCMDGSNRYYVYGIGTISKDDVKEVDYKDVVCVYQDRDRLFEYDTSYRGILIYDTQEENYVWRIEGYGKRNFSTHILDYKKKAIGKVTCKNDEDMRGLLTKDKEYDYYEKDEFGYLVELDDKSKRWVRVGKFYRR